MRAASFDDVTELSIIISAIKFHSVLVDTDPDLAVMLASVSASGGESDGEEDRETHFDLL